jgi:ABC-type transport system involved in multi-copper enzyme maturation permease subunit
MQFYKTSVELPRWICAVLVGCGVLAYIATVSTDIYYGGLATTIDHVGIAIQSTSMVVVSGFTLGLSSFAGFLLRAGRKFIAVGSLAIATLFMTFSLSNGVGFVASQSIGKAKLLEARQKQAEDLAELQNQHAIENQNWLKRTYLQTKDKVDKDKLLAQAVTPVEFKAAEIDTVMADARASVFSQLFGWKQDTVQMGAAIALPVLLVLGKLLGPLLGFAFWPIRQPKPEQNSA